MAILETVKVQNVEFFEDHYPIWSASPTTMGLTASLCTDLTSKTKAARDAYTALLAARTAAKNATQVFYDKYDQMMTAGRADIGLIKAYAESQSNPMTVYTAAQIPPPAQPGPGPVPTMPKDFSVGLNPDGSVTLKWKAVGDGNTFWLVKRKLATETEFRFVGGSGNKTFTDTGIPTGTASMQYTVFGQRGTVNGPDSNVLAVHFGGGGDGLSFEIMGATTPTTPTTQTKLAA